MYKGTGAENLRAKQATPASSVPAPAGQGGTSCGGTDSPRAKYDAPRPSIPAAAPNPGRRTQGTPFTDSKV